jgi:phage baseplate assembly protein W
VEVFSYIAYRETRCNAKAVNAKFDADGNVTWTLNKNGSIDRGLLQINSCWKAVTQKVCGTGLEGLFDVSCNLKVAKYIMDNSASGLGNWNVWKP